jgi:hypothetical protein
MDGDLLATAILSNTAIHHTRNAYTPQDQYVFYPRHCKLVGTVAVVPGAAAKRLTDLKRIRDEQFKELEGKKVYDDGSIRASRASNILARV